MTAADIGVVIIAAELSPLLLVLVPLLLTLRRHRREAEAEWARIATVVEDFRTEAESARRANLPLLERIAEDELAGFFEDWEAQA